MKVRLPDGAPQPIAPIGATRGGSSSDAGTMLIAAGGLQALPAAGGELKRIEVPTLKRGRYVSPEFLPGSEDFLFLFLPLERLEDGEVYLASLSDGKASNLVLLMKNATAARYSPAGGGRVLFIRNDNLYSQKLNSSTRKLEGEMELVVERVASQPAMGINTGDFSVARNGTVAWRSGKAALSQVTVFDRQGHPIGTAGPPGSIDSVVLSPDETHVLVFSSVDPSWLLEVGQPGRFALPLEASWFGWSPDGSKLLGLSVLQPVIGAIGLAEMPAGGSGEVRHVDQLSPGFRGRVHDISPDGKQALGMTALGRGIFSLQLYGGADKTAPRALVQTGEAVADPRYSPDGRWIVYAARDTPSRSFGVFVQPARESGGRRQIAPEGSNPAWRKDGKEILYIGEEGLMSVSVETAGNDLRFATPRLLFSGLRQPAGSILLSRPLDVSHDGSKIYWPQAALQPDSDVIHIKTGWTK
jgi:WD40 repeat protein